MAYEPVKVNVLDAADLRRHWPSKVDGVVHLVGLADAGVAHREPSRSFRLNVESNERILDICAENPVRRVVIPSTAAVYGATHQLPVSEGMPVQPTSIYGWHKSMGENLVRAYAQCYDVPYTILRLFNVYGYGHKGIIDLALRRAFNGEKLTVFGAEQARDFVYAGDVVDAFIRALDSSKSCENMTLNIGSGTRRTVRDIVQLVQEMYTELVAEFDVGDPDSLYDSVADISLARKLLGWKPEDSPEFMAAVIRREMAYS